jgi:predicted nucleic acid-binding Zn ribbon protein
MRRLAEVMPAALREMGLESGLRGWQALVEWPHAVGPQIARRSRAVRFQDGVLWVEVEGSVWLHQLTMLKRDLIRKIGERMGSDSIRDLRFINGRGGIRR